MKQTPPSAREPMYKLRHAADSRVSGVSERARSRRATARELEEKTFSEVSRGLFVLLGLENSVASARPIVVRNRVGIWSGP